MKITGLLLGIFFLTLSTYAQHITGMATYQTKTTINLDDWGGQGMSEQRKKQIMERMKNFLEKEYTLTFTQEESFFKEEERLEAPGQGAMGRWGGSFAQGGIYTNQQTHEFARANDLMGKTFLIQDSLSNLNWELVKESKIIGQYPVFKAVAQRPVEASPWEKLRAVRRQQRSELPVEDSTTTKMETIVAWYTPMIPVQHGPDEFGGLPGLILELNTANTTMLCTKVVLNPKTEITIERPEKGKVVSRKEYQEIVEEKGREMMERYGRGRGQNGGFNRRGQ
ncbi:GLPGLI family protein [Croceiramulus getboli]|nr:GLPGLI family protein [Flavobacteriaceae bacterium YJPT1-3]